MYYPINNFACILRKINVQFYFYVNNYYIICRNYLLHLNYNQARGKLSRGESSRGILSRGKLSQGKLSRGESSRGKSQEI